MLGEFLGGSGVFGEIVFWEIFLEGAGGARSDSLRREGVISAGDMERDRKSVV